MADPQFEQFREVFERLPQHIKAPTYCYRFAHDVILDNEIADNDDDDENVLGIDDNDDVSLLQDHRGGGGVGGVSCPRPFATSRKSSVDGAFGTPLCWKETNWTENSCKDALPTLKWVTSTSDVGKTSIDKRETADPKTPSSSSSSSSQTSTTSTRKRRRLPEIPKEKTAVRTSIVFRTQALSLAEEILEAESASTSNLLSTASPLDGASSPKHSKQHRSPKRLLPFCIKKSPRLKYDDDDDSSPDEKVMNTDFDSGNSTGHSPDVKSFCSAATATAAIGNSVVSCSGFSPRPESPASSSGVSTTTLESCLESHRGLHKFIPRHRDEVEIEIGDPLYVQKEADDLWCEGINLRTGKSGIFPSAYVTDVEYSDFDPELTVRVKKERFLLKFLGSVEVAFSKGNDVLCQAIRKITATNGGDVGWMPLPHPCVLEISDQGLRMVDKSKPSSPNGVPCHDYFFFLKNISFCGFHPDDYRYFGFITKHPTKQRFACHVFIGDDSTRPVAESVGRAFQRFYHKFIETAYPIEDIYLE